MIILDDKEEGSSKLADIPSATLRHPDPVAGRSSTFLPDYEPLRPAVSGPPLSDLPTDPTPTAQFHLSKTIFSLLESHLCRSRYLCFLTIVIGVPLIVTVPNSPQEPTPTTPKHHELIPRRRRRACRPYIFSTGPGMLMAASSMICDIWDSEDRADALYVATARHTLAPSGVPRPGGMHNLTVAVNDDASEKQAVFIVTLTSSSPELRDQTHVCFSQANQTRGLSLYLPQYDLAPTDVLAFDIRLLFPQNAAFAKFDPRIQFRKINVVGAGVDIICDNLHAGIIAVKNSYASISGSFNVTKSLTLDNIEGPITANTTLNNDPTTGLATYLVMDTGNSNISAQVTLDSPSRQQPPKFNVNVQTFNGSLWVNALHSNRTISSATILEVDNNQGQSQVAVDSKFQGYWDLRTKIAPAILHWHLNVDSNLTSSKRGGYFNPATDGC
ncbi:hypothetical protein B0H13DRAFT_1977219 [Mycena leptocephala]|nr:hypothetical protein B0H13DRAFT_1977219 [Mycena leptocephala]